ncbi:MAG: TIGR03617 family F420-dependent LLM class oxidoreductase [Pseudomonadales bacterium]|jgi:probable F420-dependent oxidoreductase|nr:TIGR03617 family F420-dependent LLM class oxidoreductase [Pseudomonadales bacterium]MDP6471109.1 TIGR03617 family F420-dependent LLM class oxidoreductase [Pseudomonadales bacterium]MDP6825705.1 TIGR03617 family F420-dependent LLM class oxidoreductase [Pseudomonadales bacterium]MDP6973161.1 TIGR03617 family F420-dependent LLM class oxidoreductase [Pseudomonadales bacterium]|tara:strand:+ start:197 stop:1204 length:1008 start_codon:yes stop_codon:yes gene_type:complete
MKVDGGVGWELDKVGDQARRLEELGYSGILSAETSHDPFFPLLVAAQNTQSVDLMTSIAVAFGRSPMTLANIGHDLNAASKGRFILGLGSQIRAHITKRFSMPWSSPAARMREFILAMRAIWATWHEGEPLEFTGKFYTHTLMTPFFTPTDNEFGAPRVALAAVGPKMTEVAGEVADSIIVHAFTTETYLRETTLPALERGFAKGGKTRADFEIAYPVFVVTADTEEGLEQSKVQTKQQIAFYGSTPAYKPVLESIGAGELQGELNAMSKQGRWVEMGGLIDESMVNAFAVVGEPDTIAAQIKSRYGDIVDRTSAAYGNIPAGKQQQIVRELKAS